MYNPFQMVPTYYTHLFDIYFSFSYWGREKQNRNSPHLLIFRKKIWNTKSNSVLFFSLYEDFDLWLPVRSPSEANNSKEIVLGHFFDWYLFRVSKWTLPANLFPCGAIGLTLHYEKKRTIMRTINYNDKKSVELSREERCF